MGGMPPRRGTRYPGSAGRQVGNRLQQFRTCLTRHVASKACHPPKHTKGNGRSRFRTMIYTRIGGWWHGWHALGLMAAAIVVGLALRVWHGPSTGAPPAVGTNDVLQPASGGELVLISSGE